MPGYDPDFIDRGLDMLILLITSGQIDGGIFQADIVNDEVIVSLVERLD
jgi:hypothetical protein